MYEWSQAKMDKKADVGVVRRNQKGVMNTQQSLTVAAFLFTGTLIFVFFTHVRMLSQSMDSKLDGQPHPLYPPVLIYYNFNTSSYWCRDCCVFIIPFYFFLPLLHLISCPVTIPTSDFLSFLACDHSYI